MNFCYSCGIEIDEGLICDLCISYEQEQRELEENLCVPTTEEIADDFEFFIKQIIERQTE